MCSKFWLVGYYNIYYDNFMARRLVLPYEQASYYFFFALYVGEQHFIDLKAIKGNSFRLINGNFLFDNQQIIFRTLFFMKFIDQSCIDIEIDNVLKLCKSATIQFVLIFFKYVEVTCAKILPFSIKSILMCVYTLQSICTRMRSYNYNLRSFKARKGFGCCKVCIQIVFQLPKT